MNQAEQDKYNKAVTIQKLKRTVLHQRKLVANLHLMRDSNDNKELKAHYDREYEGLQFIRKRLNEQLEPDKIFISDSVEIKFPKLT